jgi:hypothetical protein
LTDSLRALVSNIIDYAGLYPPAGLPLAEVLERYRTYRASAESWMLNRLVLPAGKLAEARLEEGWRVTLLADGAPGPLPDQVETLETKQLLADARGSDGDLPVYCETPLEQIPERPHTFAKIRTGGLTPEAIPSCPDLAQFLHAAAMRRIPFKATAGLHHPIRAEYPLTYAPDAPRAVMHGFLNVFAAAALAWHGAPVFLLTAILEETDASAFRFLEGELVCGHGRGPGLGTGQIKAARLEFAHSFGSCSFEEPVAGLREMGLLP